MFLTFLLNNKTLILITALLIAMASEGVYITTLKSEAKILVAEKATLTTMLTESQANLKQLQSDIQAQNTAINALKAEADARVAKHAVEVKQAQTIANSYKQKADDLLKLKAPSGIPVCDAANELINKEIKNAHN